MCKSDNSDDASLAINIVSSNIDDFSPYEVRELQKIIRRNYDWSAVDFPIEIYVKLGQNYD